jgi:hypothetical protein
MRDERAGFSRVQVPGFPVDEGARPTWTRGIQLPSGKAGTAKRRGPTISHAAVTSCADTNVEEKRRRQLQSAKEEFR